jgi:hypothetical protein
MGAREKDDSCLVVIEDVEEGRIASYSFHVPINQTSMLEDTEILRGSTFFQKMH